MYGPGDVARLMDDASIVRNKGKIPTTIDNARAALLARLRPLLVGGAVVTLPPSAFSFKACLMVPAKTAELEDLAKELKSLWLKHVGPIVAYSLMQAMGVVDDHLASFFLAPDIFRTLLSAHPGLSGGSSRANALPSHPGFKHPPPPSS